MSRAPIDLADLHHLPWTQPAPTGGGDKPDTGPGNGDRPGPCVARSNEQMSTDARAVTTDLWAAIGRSRRARGADTELREVA